MRPQRNAIAPVAMCFDLSGARRSKGPRALEDFASAADDKAVMVTLRSINVDIHKVLKLARLSSRFSIVN